MGEAVSALAWQDRVDVFEPVSPLPSAVRQSLVPMLILGMMSLLTTTLLWLHISYKLVLWKIRDARCQTRQLVEAPALGRPAPAPPSKQIDLNLGLTEDQYYQARYRRNGGEGAKETFVSTQQEPATIERTDTTASQPAAEQAMPSSSTRRDKPPNPLLLLIYNLLLADMILSAAYISDAVWLGDDAITVPSVNCTSQGWVVSFGCLTTSGFLFTISVFSYLGIIRGYRTKSRDVLVACSAVWILSVLLASLGPMFVRDGTYFGRETLWCWISEDHRLWRLSVYLWGFPAMLGTCMLYGVIFWRLYREGRSSRYMPRRRRGSSIGSGATAINNHHNTATTALRPSGHHPAFLIYPCIYTATGTPLMLGSLIPALERSPAFMGAAGTLLASTGLLDALLWSSIILFSGREDMVNTGLEQFAFVRTPEGRTLGNIVFVQGGGGAGGGQDGGGGGSGVRSHRQSWHSRKEKGWWKLGPDKERSGSDGLLDLSPFKTSRERLPDGGGGDRGIQMQVVTSVVVEGQGSAQESMSSEVAKSVESSSL